MGVTVHPGRLRQEMARRGWAAADLAREARISAATVSSALNGRPISPSSLALMVQALSRTPTNAMVDALLMVDRQHDVG